MATTLIADTKILGESIADAQRLLQYASAKGIAIPADVMANIVQSQSLADKDPADTATYKLQQDFWAAFASLSHATEPATVESLKYELAQPPGVFAVLWAKIRGQTDTPSGPTAAERAVGRARNWALIGLGLVAVFQAYFEVGNSTLTSFQDAQRLVAEKTVFVQSSDKQIEAATSAKQSPQEIATLRKAHDAAQVERDQAINATDRRLRLMRRMMGWIDWEKQFAKDANAYEKTQTTLAVLQGYLLVLREFVLPMSWGFLGAALYVSRALAEDIRTTAYAPHRAVLFRTRYFMGTVAGFIVAKLFPVALGMNNETITPLAMAMVVGYSVEVLFSFLEKLIATFSTKKMSQ